MDQISKLLILYEELTRLRSKIHLKNAKLEGKTLKINFFGKYFEIKIINDKSEEIVCLKFRKFNLVTRKIDLAKMQIFTLIGLYQDTSLLPDSVDQEIKRTEEMIVKIRHLLVRKTKESELAIIANKLDKLYGDNEAV
jgi:hypothetical protein